MNKIMNEKLKEYNYINLNSHHSSATFGFLALIFI